jgi:hypothetical protein
MLGNRQVECSDFIDDLLSIISRIMEVPGDKKVPLREAIIKLFKLRGKKLFRTLLRIYKYGE